MWAVLEICVESRGNRFWDKDPQMLKALKILHVADAMSKEN